MYIARKSLVWIIRTISLIRTAYKTSLPKGVRITGVGLYCQTPGHRRSEQKMVVSGLTFLPVYHLYMCTTICICVLLSDLSAHVNCVSALVTAQERVAALCNLIVLYIHVLALKYGVYHVLYNMVYSMVYSVVYSAYTVDWLHWQSSVLARLNVLSRQ